MDYPARERHRARTLSGVRKTHMALELGLAACQQGFSVSFTTAAALVHELMEARVRIPDHRDRDFRRNVTDDSV